jgi:DNA-binding NtrC family response regulator
MKKKYLNIMIADDKKIVHQTMAPLLRDSGHSMESTKDGFAGLSLMGKNDYDFTLMDVHPPGKDEISVLSKTQGQKPDLSAAAQAELLRVLATRSVQKVGGAREVPVNVRMIAATNRPLVDLVKSGKFRQDLLQKLNIFTIDLKSLQERKEDLIILAEHFLSAFVASSGAKVDGFSNSAKQALLNYSFPGNARELKNIVQCAAIMAKSGLIEPRHIFFPNEQIQAPG